MIKYDNTGQFIVNSVKYTWSKKSRAVKRVFFFFFMDRETKNQRSLNITGQMAGTSHACTGKILGHMVRPWS